MRLSRMTAAVAMASMAVAPALAGTAPAIGKVTAASNGAFVSRNGQLLPAVAGQSLFAGDRIVTRGKSTAKASFSQGCSYSVVPGAVLSVGATGCAKGAQAVAVQDDSTTEGGAAAADTGASGTSYVILGAAFVAFGTGIYFAVDNPSSP